jgi:hypothetical protein
MNIKTIVLVFAGILLLSANVSARQPSMASRNIDFDLQILDEPKQVGDILRVSWSFTLRESDDPVLRSYQQEHGSTMYARAYLGGIDMSDIVGGEAIWQGEVEYDKTYNLILSVEVKRPGKINLRPVVEIYSDPSNQSYSTRLSQNFGKVTAIKIEGSINYNESPPESNYDMIRITTQPMPASIKRRAVLSGDSSFAVFDNPREMPPTETLSGDGSKQTWTVSGHFYYDDAFGGSYNPVAWTECDLYLWTGGDQYAQYLAQVYTDSDGGFQFNTDADSISIVIFSYDSLSNVFYADDSCFDFSQGEGLYNHYFAVSVANPSHNNISVSTTYTQIHDLSLAGAFNIQAIIRNAFSVVDHPDFLAPVYFLDKDECAENSSFGRFSEQPYDIPGIQIRGSYDDLDWDQWDTSVVDHELGHLYQWAFASMPMYSGGVHYFNSPTPTAGVNDLYLAFVEAWATFFACRVIDAPIYIDRAYDLEDTIIWANLEQPSPDVPFSLDMPQTDPSDTVAYYEGAHVEGSIALALWDLYDDVNDGYYYISSELYGHNNDSNANESWNGWDAINDVLIDFDPDPYDNDHQNCWSIYEFLYGWRLFEYPTNDTFTNIFEAHNVPVFLPGDADNNQLVNIFDISYIISFLYYDGPAPKNKSAADVNGDCAINALDISYLVSFLYQQGPDLLVGCVNLYPN